MSRTLQNALGYPLCHHHQLPEAFPVMYTHSRAAAVYASKLMYDLKNMLPVGISESGKL